MEVFEFHFNPKLRPDLIFDSFCYHPENIYEKRLGNLYLVGLLKNVLPQNLNFLDKLAKVIQKEYYRSTFRKPEKALKESLKVANEFLEKEAKKGEVSWLGNLSFAVLSLKNYQLNFTKIGDLKIFLLRGGKVIDIDKKLRFEEITPWPLKIFGNIISGKLTEADVLLISSKEITDFFEKENLLPEIGKIWPLNEKELKEIFDKKKEEVLKICGISLFIVLTKEALARKKEIITPKIYPKEFHFREIFSPSINFFKKLTIVSKPKLGKFPKLAILQFLNIEKTLLNISRGLQTKLNKKIILILALILFLTMGFFIAEFQEERELRERLANLEKIQERVNRAESFLILKTPQAEKEANLLLKESWEEILKLSKITPYFPKDFKSQVSSLKDEISKNLFKLNKLEITEEPELIFNFADKKFFPQKIMVFKDDFYFFSPYSQNLFKVDKEGKEKLFEIDKKFSLATSLEDSLLFFLKPNQITILKDEKFFEFSLKEPYSDFSFDDFSSFRGNLYFLDKKASQIIKYPYQGNFQWENPLIWLKRKVEGKSIAVDGSIWILEKDNSIKRYYAGNLQEKIELNIFPPAKDFSKIFTSAFLPYIYLLEPIQKRIVILNKAGQIIQQFQSQKFDNLLDFAVSGNGKTIWLLNGLKVYQISFAD